jgi:hypothetical protein
MNRNANVLDLAVAMMVLAGWCAWLWTFYSLTAK